MHSDAPSSLLVPIAQIEQLWLAIGAYVPAGQSVASEAPVTFTKLPAGAKVHWLEPGLSAYMALGHGSQGPSPAPLDVPGGHGVHSLAPLEELE